MRIIKSVSEALSHRALLKSTEKVGFVPTMGALHKGHESLIKESKRCCDYTIVSIFINPEQFAPNEDFDKYPKLVDSDIKKCEQLGVDMLFIPTVNEIYPNSEKIESYIPPKELNQILCSMSRPHFFKGVCKVVLRLFRIINPTHAFFGLKDLQQRYIIGQMVEDLDLSIQVIGCPIIRDENGLAESSRNQYLSEGNYKKALAFPNTLLKVKEKFTSGETSASKLIKYGYESLIQSKFEVDYIDFFDPLNQCLENIEIKEEHYLCVAIICDSIRLIDNCSMKKEF